MLTKRKRERQKDHQYNRRLFEILKLKIVN